MENKKQKLKTMCRVLLETHTDNDRNEDAIIEKRKEKYRKKIEKIDTPHGRGMYSKRMGIVEPVFENIRYCKGLNRFTLRGREKVNIQWLLYCCVHNIEKTLKAVE